MTEHPMKPLCVEWLAKIELARQSKKERFGCYAEEAMKFFDGAHDWMWDQKYSQAPGGFLEKGAAQLPKFRMTVNRAFEVVALFGPAMYHKNPNVLVTPRDRPSLSPLSLGLDINNPYHAQAAEQHQMQRDMERQVRMDQASVLNTYSNWVIEEGGLKRQARFTLTEALIKGLSLLWIEAYRPKASSIVYPRARHVSVDDLVVDPDATSWEDVQWVARRCEHPVNLVERKYNLPPGTIKGHKQSLASQATERGRKEAKNNQKGKSWDNCEYWEVYSKNGFGQRLYQKDNRSLDKHYDFESFGDNCLIVVAKDIPFPLNIPTETLGTFDPQDPASPNNWPIPFWADEAMEGGWPFARFYFYDKPNSVWPISLIKPAIGEMRFVNWCMSFLADKVASSCTTYLGVMKAAAADIQKQLADQRMGNGSTPFTMLEISETLQMPLNQLVAFLQAPEFQQHIWTMLVQVNQSIDKRLSLIDLRYGFTENAMRSATEADVKEQGLSIVPDDMASKTEDSLKETAVKQIVAAYWLCGGEDVRGPLGDDGAFVWDQQIRTMSLDEVLRDFNFQVEAGSARKPNKNNKIRTLQEFGQIAIQPLVEMAMAGNVDPWNAYVSEWCKANDIDPTPFLLQLPEAQGPSPEQVEIEAKVAELEMKQAEMAMKLGFDQQSHKQELRQDQEKHKAEMAMLKQKAKAQSSVDKQKLAIQKQQAKLKPKAGAKK